jgi:hypothetical protein
MKYLLVLLILSFLVVWILGDDKQYAHPLMSCLPAEAHFIKAYKDNHNDSLKNSQWIKYELEGECFIFSSYYNNMNTKVDCNP